MTDSPTLTPAYVTALARTFADAVAATPPDEPLTDRARTALERLPDDLVQQLGDAAAVLVHLSRERLSTSGKATIHIHPDPPHVADAVRRARRGC